MNKLETPMTRWYWDQVGGSLVEDFLAVPRGADCGQRLVDALIIHDGHHRVLRTRDFDKNLLRDADITIVQSKAKRLGLAQMGQALFSIGLLERYDPRSVVSVALCSEDDAVLRPLLEAHEGLKVVVCPPEIVPR